MRLAIVIERYDPAAGGNERSTRQIAAELARRGHAVTILANRVRGEMDEGVQYEVSGGMSTRGALGLWRFRRWAMRRLEQGAFDASISMTSAVPADLVQLRSGTVRETLRRNVALRKSPVRKALKELAIAVNPKHLAQLAAEPLTINHHRVHKLVAISRYVADQLIGHYAVATKRIALVPNAVTIDVPSAEERLVLRERTRRALQLEEHDTVYLFAAVNPRLKGLAELIEAFAQLRADKVRAKLIVAGSMDRGWIERVEQRGLAGQVRWIGPTKQMDRLYLAADVTVLPTWYDPNSRVVLESLRLGTPAISTRHNGASQWIADPTGQAEWFGPMDGGSAQMPASPAAGRVIDEADRIEQLVIAMRDLSKPSAREACRRAATSLDPRLTMTRHVDALEELLIKVAEKC